MVLVFFGFVATVGSAYVQHEPIPGDGVVRRARGRAARRARSCSPTTCATSRPTASPASARSRCASARARARLLYVACIVGALGRGSRVRACRTAGAARTACRAARGRAGPARADPPRSAVARRRADRHGALPARARRAARGSDCGWASRDSARTRRCSRRAPPGCSSGSACPPSSADDARPRARSRSSICARDRVELRVAACRSRAATGISRSRESVPHRFHRARAEHAQACARYSGRSAAPLVDAGCVRPESIANIGCASQRVEERVDAVAFDVDGQRLVGRDARRRVRRRCAMPGDRAHEHESAHDVGSVEREPQAQAARPSSSRRTRPDRRRAPIARAVAANVGPIGSSSNADGVARVRQACDGVLATSRRLGEPRHEARSARHHSGGAVAR